MIIHQISLIVKRLSFCSQVTFFYFLLVRSWSIKYINKFLYQKYPKLPSCGTIDPGLKLNKNSIGGLKE